MTEADTVFSFPLGLRGFTIINFLKAALFLVLPYYYRWMLDNIIYVSKKMESWITKNTSHNDAVTQC